MGRKGYPEVSPNHHTSKAPAGDQTYIKPPSSSSNNYHAPRIEFYKPMKNYMQVGTSSTLPMF